MRSFLLLCVMALSSCGDERPDVAQPNSAPRGSCGCIAVDEPWTDEAVLTPHVDEKSYLGSVVSFRWATTVDRGQVGNDWDLSLTTSTTSRDQLSFRVNLVTDDRSCIQDLGAIPLVEVPQFITRCDDHLTVVEDHVYLVENRDPDQQQFSAFVVTRVDGVRSASLRWYRSARPDRFTFERAQIE